MSTAFFSHGDCLLDEMGHWHPELPVRLQAIEDQLIASGLSGLITRREAPLASIADLRRVHSAAMIDRVQAHQPLPDDDNY
jgi:acetoin utilization deacetylase AcuC-like enzyme